MNTQTANAGSFPRPLIWAAGIAIILFCGAGIAALMGWLPSSMGRSDESVAPTSAAAPATARPVTTPAPQRPHSPPVQVAASQPTAVKCADCGVIESVREVKTKGQGSGLGVVGGAVVGGLLGNQVGGGRGKDIATVAGVVGGGFAGNEIEKRVKSTSSFEAVVRMEDGSTRTVPGASASSHNGDHVRIVDGAIRAN